MRTLYISINISAGVAAIATIGVIFLAGNQQHPYQQGGGLESDGSQLVLALSMNSTKIATGQEMGMDISLTNPSPSRLSVPPKHDWPLRKWSMGPCLFHLPFGMVLLKGNYGVDNMSDGQRLTLYPRGLYLCRPIGITGFVFEPSSSRVIVETYNSSRQVTMKYHVAFNGFYEGQKFQPMDPGVYTVVGDDQWGHSVVRHFTVTR